MAVELGLGRGHDLIVVSNARESAILAFVDQRQTAEWRGGTINSLQLIDVDGDGILEVVVDETYLYGTGVLATRAIVFKATTAGLAKLWEGMTQMWVSPGPDERRAAASPVRKVGFLSFGHSERGDLVYVVHDLLRGSWEECIYRWNGRKLLPLQPK